MSQDKSLTRSGIVLRVLGAVFVVGIAGALGTLLGRVTAPTLISEQAEPAVPEVAVEGAAAPTVETDAPLPAREPPIFLHIGRGSESVPEALAQEVNYAMSAGLHQYIVPIPLPWGDSADPAASTAPLEAIRALDPDATFLVQLNFNPPATWFDEFDEARMRGLAGDIALPTPASDAWLDASRAAIDRVYAHFRDANLLEAVAGLVLEGLRNGRWRGGEGVDTSGANVRGFRAWLQRRYADDTGLRKAWHQDDVSLETASPPEGNPDIQEVFLRLEEDAARIDYATYRANAVADAIGALASHARETVGAAPTLWAAYGFTFEMGGTRDGHLALGALLDSDLDGFIAPVSLANRGVGGTGGYMGPIHSARAHGKQWIIVDDTRTGIAWNPDTSKIEPIPGLRAEDVYNVQRRNFALAAVHGLGLAWSDPMGQGALASDTQWSVLGNLLEVYRNHVDYPGSRKEITRQTYPEEAPPQSDPTLLVVVDEESQFLTRGGADLPALLAHNRDEALRAGVSTEFCLLDDLIDGVAPRAAVYLLLNAYILPSAQRQVLHERFAEEAATAIWVYAPGYRDVTLMAGNIGDTVGMTVKPFDEPTVTGSVYSLGGGHWVNQNQTIGNAREIAPLFYIDDNDTDVLAQFKQSEKPSVAMRTMEAGWTSVYIADPELSAPLLRELLRILEQQVYFRPGKQRYFDVTVAHSELIAIHAGQVGERIVNLGQFYDIQDLFDPAIGWPQKESFVLTMEQGETRLLQLSQL